MSTHDSSSGIHYLNVDRGFWSWFWTLDHKRLGLLYMWSVISMMIVGGFFAIGLRSELFSPGADVLTADQFNHFFTLHGAIMVFLVIIPSIPAALGNFALPIMLGAKDVAFPKLNRMSYHLWVMGAILMVTSIFRGGLDTGWTFYPPYSTTTDTAVFWALGGVLALGFSSIFTGINFLSTIHKMRPPGMAFFQMPLFLWAMYATAVIQVLATPVIAIALLMLGVERGLGIGFFDPTLGGDPFLFQHLFWFYSHPAVYIMILPAMGVLSELFATFSRKHIFGYKYIAYSSIAIAMFSFVVWGHHLFVAGQSQVASVIFSAVTFSVAIPSAVKVFNWVATMYKGSVSMDTPMIFAMSVIWLFGIGGVTGLFLAMLTTDMHLHDTYFVVAHFHFVMVGSALFAFMGGIHYWWPKMFGVMYRRPPARFLAVMAFIGFNLTFMPLFLAGTQGMQRRIFDYVPRFEGYNQLATYGSYVLGIALFGTLFNLLGSLKGRRGKLDSLGEALADTTKTLLWIPRNMLATGDGVKAGLFVLLSPFLVPVMLILAVSHFASWLADAILIRPMIHVSGLIFGNGGPASPNPWGGATLEWHTPSPAPPHNFDEAPIAGDPYAMEIFRFESKEAGYVPVNPDPKDPHLAQPLS